MLIVTGFWPFLFVSFGFQIEYIKECFVDKVKQQIEFTKVLEDEIKLLNEIEKKRNKIRKETHDKYMDQMLDKMGAPVKWIGYKSNAFAPATHILKIHNCLFIALYILVSILVRFFFALLCSSIISDIICEMDLLQCQKIRKLTTLYRQLKISGTNRFDRIEFLNELHGILVEEPHSTLLDEVSE